MLYRMNLVLTPEQRPKLKAYIEAARRKTDRKSATTDNPYT